MREAYIREGPDVQDEQALRVVVRHCATCSKPYPFDTACTHCTYNAACYGYDIKRVQLLRASYTAPSPHEQAYIEYKAEKERDQNSGLVFCGIAVGVVILLFGGIWLYDCIGGATRGDYTYTPLKIVPAQSTGLQRLSEANGAQARYEEQRRNDNNAYDEQRAVREIQGALYQVRNNIRDITGDRVINCQDYAAMFLWYFPNAEIIYNPYIGPTGHVFNAVRLADGRRIYIEPQNTSKWLMREAWTQWESTRQYNQEATARFRRQR